MFKSSMVMLSRDAGITLGISTQPKFFHLRFLHNINLHRVDVILAQTSNSAGMKDLNDSTLQ